MKHNIEIDKAGVYRITNLVNGKFYIGSSNKLMRRYRRHKKDLKNDYHPNQLLQRAYNKYGEDNFSFEVLEYIEDKELARSVEQRYLDFMRPFDREIGYNICLDSRGLSGVKRSKEWCEFMGNVHRGKTVSKETRNKIGDANRNPSAEKRKAMGAGNIGNKYRLGKPMSDKVKAALLKANLGKKFSEDRKARMSFEMKLKNVSKVICPHCNKEGGEHGMKSTHFDNCKMKVA